MKPTRLVCSFLPAESLGRRCKLCRGRCSRTNKPHVSLTGKDCNGIFKTRVAEEYPKRFSRALASAFANGFKSLKATSFSAVL